MSIDTVAKKSKKQKLEDDFVQQPSRIQQESSRPLSQRSWILPSTKRPKTIGKRTHSEPDPDTFGTLWVDKYVPQTEATCAVHKKKFEQVRNWVRSALSPSADRGFKRERLLILTGPSGSGKTAVINVLAKELGFEIMEWVNPVNVNHWDGEGQEYVPVMRRFQEFLSRAEKYPSLSFTSCDAHSPPSTGKSTSLPRLVLIEDLPNISTPSTRMQFQNSIRNYVNDSRSRYPVILIMSDTGIRNTEMEESLLWGGEARRWRDKGDGSADVRNAIPPDVLGGRRCEQIGFNPIAPTIMMKALKSVIAEQFPKKSDRSAPSSEHLSAIADMSHGDIRNAINTLQFFCLKPPESPPAVVAVEKRKRTKDAKRKEETPKCVASDEAIGTREPILSMFHALGKILRNKRIPKECEESFVPSGSEESWKLPGHLNMHERPKMAVDPEKVIESISTEPDTFSLFLHQNYIDYMTEVEECVMGTQWFSCADALMGAGGWKHARHLLPYASLITARGVMHSQYTEKESRFQQSYKPELFEMLRSFRANSGKFREIREDLVKKETGNHKHGIGATYGSSATAFNLDTLPFMAVMDRNSRQQGLESPNRLSSLTMDQRTFLRAVTTFQPYHNGFRRGGRATLGENDTGWMGVDVDDDVGSPGEFVPGGNRAFDNVPHPGTSRKESCFIEEDDIEEF